MVEQDPPAEKFTPEHLQDCTDGDVELERDLIDTYKKGVSGHLLGLEVTITTRRGHDPNPNGNHPSVLHAQYIKSSSADIGATGVQWVSEKIELFCSERDFERAVRLLPELRDELLHVYALLDAYVAHPEMNGSPHEMKGLSYTSAENVQYAANTIRTELRAK